MLYQLSYPGFQKNIPRYSLQKGGKTGATGLEPATSAVTGQRSNQLSYAPFARYYHTVFSRVYQCRREESDLRPRAYESLALPLSYADDNAIVPIPLSFDKQKKR